MGVERCFFVLATWLPISIVYGATGWAVFVNVFLVCIRFVGGFFGIHVCWRMKLTLLLGWVLGILSLMLYGLCIWSYSVAVFTDPGSPLEAVWTPCFSTDLCVGQWIQLSSATLSADAVFDGQT